VDISQNFTRRLERLKIAKSWTDEELSAEIGISRRMLYLMKTGKNPITVKSEMKLEAAEREAGIQSPDRVQPLEHPTDKKSNDWKIKESRRAYDSDMEELKARFKNLEDKFDIIIKRLGG